MKYPQNQNGKNRPQYKEWQDIRAELMQFKTKFNLSDDEFRPLSPNEDFKGIEEKIYQTFCHLETGKSRPVWLWEDFKQAEFAVFNLPKLPETYLSELIDNTESILFGALESYRETSKIWWYEGKILVIQKLLAETHFFDEVYFVSKKFNWLICINHHDVLIVTGQEMPEKLADLESKVRPTHP